ncbi:MAG TPA: c-type cytochrome [Pirellulales bacterium]|nr:c-type cytochrome [Pirellulales bacterium]
MRFARLPITAVLALAVLAGRAAHASGTEDDDEGPALSPGLVARYTADGGVTCLRRDETIQFAWDNLPPDERLPPGEFAVEWRGSVQAMAPGDYTFYLHATGEAAVQIEGREIIRAKADRPQWFESAPVELEYGYHAIQIRYHSASGAARIGLFWSGPKFELEPLPAQALWHEPADDPGERFERGGELWRALRCSNCHRAGRGGQRGQGEASGVAKMAPDLSRLAGNISRRWLVDWLRGTDRDKTTSLIRMPDFALSEDETYSIAAYLFDASQVRPDSATGGHESATGGHGEPPGAANEGERLVLTLGCLACHRLGDLGAAGLFGGGDLTHIADKRPRDFFARWLEDPAATNPAHRMPVFRLSPTERANLAAYLTTLRSPAAQEEDEPAPSTAPLVTRGKQLVEELRCGACHHLPQPAIASVNPPHVDPKGPRGGGCLGLPDRPARRPGYHLSKSDRAALEEYLAVRISPARPDGLFVLREHNCLACHSRDATPGIAEQLPRTAQRHSELAPRLPTLSPPSLTQVGDKLHDSALADAIALRGPPLRPWLAVRMPRFSLSPEELTALTQYLTTIDRIPDRAKDDFAPKALERASLVAAGSRLVNSTGFGCTSCHQIGHSLPKGVALAAHGTDLSRVGRRIRREWFDRWVHNPARIVPRIEMPSIQVAVPGVLGGRLDDQLAAVWHVLNLPGFEPPLAGPIRIARHMGDAGPAVVITDVVETPDRVLVRPLVVGLSNRQNLLFDLARNQLSGWWQGDTARQRTRGKAWYWELAGKNLFSADGGPGGEIKLLGPGTSSGEVAPGLVPGGSDVDRKNGVQGSGVGDQDGNRRAARGTPATRAGATTAREMEPVAFRGHALAELDRWEQMAEGVRIGYRLKFAGDTRPITLRVEQEITPARGERGLGFRRRWTIRGAPEDSTLRLQLAPPGQNVIASGSGLTIDERDAKLSIEVVAPRAEGARRPLDDEGCVLLPAVGAEAPIVCEAVYLTNATSEPPPIEEPHAASQPAALAVVPGYEAVRLALPRDEMPTGLAWRPDGTLAFCSLKGGVWLARDSDGDGLEDSLQNFADGLPAPYGLAPQGDGLDVCAKYGVIRLTDADGDGHAERSEVVASGWGYTADYHDWTVGLPRDDDGNYYIALPCQQDDRSPDEAYLRGAAVKLTSREPSPEEPRRYGLELLSAGLRFPMGLAIDPDGALFATDNQGNYTPFNELNHIVPGARYGFINKLEAKPGFQPAFEEPAVAIPHPWTRSVNGICFLTTPEAVRRKGGDTMFGPFEGQLLGCEYDTRRLIRLSLEKIGDTYQGAAYPFNSEPAAGAETFEGPVVCAVSPAGDVYIGNLRDSGWGGGQNTGSIVRLRPSGELPLGIAEIHAEHDGFSLIFTGPVAAEQARLVKNYSVSSYRRITTPAYGSLDVDRAEETITAVEVPTDGRSARLRLARLRPDFVYELRVANLAPHGRVLFPAEAYYTLRKIPQ